MKEKKNVPMNDPRSFAKTLCLVVGAMLLSGCIYTVDTYDSYDDGYTPYAADDDTVYQAPNSRYAVRVQTMLGFGHYGRHQRIHFDATRNGMFHIRNHHGLSLGYAVRQHNGDYVIVDDFNDPVIYLIYVGGGYYRIEDPLGFYYGYFDYYRHGHFRLMGLNDYYYSDIWFQPYYFTAPYRGYDRSFWRKQARYKKRYRDDHRKRRDAVYDPKDGYQPSDRELEIRNSMTARQARYSLDRSTRRFDDIETRRRLFEREHRADFNAAQRPRPNNTQLEADQTNNQEDFDQPNQLPNTSWNRPIRDGKFYQTRPNKPVRSFGSNRSRPAPVYQGPSSATSTKPTIKGRPKKVKPATPRPTTIRRSNHKNNPSAKEKN